MFKQLQSKFIKNISEDYFEYLSKTTNLYGFVVINAFSLKRIDISCLLIMNASQLAYIGLNT